MNKLVFDPRRGLPSASSMARLKECPGSLALSNYVKREGYFVPTNIYANLGIRIHRRLASDFQANNSTDQLDETEEDLCEKCRQLRDSLIADWLGLNAQPPDFFAEVRLWYRNGDIPVFSGQPDLIVLDRSGKRGLLLDYKTGRSQPEPIADNHQLRAEVVLLKHTLPKLEEIEAAIIEPWVSWESIRVSYSGEAFKQAEQEILSICDAAAFGQSERHAGEWCRYCSGRVYCKEAFAYIEKIPSFPAVNRDSLDDEGLSKAKFDIETLFRDLPRGPRGAEIWRRLKIAEKLLEAITQTYLKILETDPDALPGFILPKEGRERRIVPYPAKLKAALAEYLTGDEIDGCAQYYPGQIEKLFGMKHKVSGKELEHRFAELTEGTIEVLHDRPFIRELTKREREQNAAIAANSQ
jgi:PD-(D/E)XK nuclease superfamily